MHHITTPPSHRSANDNHRPYLVQSGITTTELAEVLATDQPRLRVRHHSHRLRRGHSRDLEVFQWGTEMDDLQLFNNARSDVRRFGYCVR